MFKKPRRHFRQRKLTEGSEEDEENHNDESFNVPTKAVSVSAKGSKVKSSTTTSTSSNNKIKKKDKTTIKPATPISFEFHGSEGEDCETFQVKKSSQSRKLVKQLKKEKKKEKSDSDEDAGSNRRGDNDNGTTVILNGDKALDMELDSDYEPDDGENEKQPKHSFRSVLERGEIPDANLIHLARKKRAQARERGDYIPLDDTENKIEQAPKSTQRLIRDDDNDVSDDEDRVDFSVNTALRDRQKMKDTFLAAEHGSDEDSEHEREWEEQQIRKVVGGQHEQSQPESANMTSYYSMNQADYTQMAGSQYDIPNSSDLKPLPDNMSIDQIKKSLQERLTNLQQVHRVHSQERENVRAGLEQSQRSADELENRSKDSTISKLNNKYKFMQEMRAYVRDLINCYNEKYEKIGELDKKMMTLAKTRSDKLCKRRQDDIKDEANDCSSALNKVTKTAETPVEKRQQAIKQRRTADREARRTRRRQARLDNGTQDQHDDGLSSDDEESKSDTLKYQNEKDAILTEVNELFEDVIDEFALPRMVLDRFSEWKTTYADDYNDAYVGLCLPKLLSPLIKLSLIDWNPLEDEQVNLQELIWYRATVLYGHSNTFDASDPDNELLPLIVEKVLIPKLTGYVEIIWDPVSTSQTRHLSALLHSLVDQYPTVNSSSKNTLSLLQTLCNRITVSLDEDTFMPLYSKELLYKSTEARSFLHRQIWSSIKLFKNILMFSGLLSDSKLKVFSLDSILNRYIMLGLQCAGIDNSIKRIRAIVDALPSRWLNTATGDKTIPQLENLCRYIRTCATTYHSMCDSSSDSVRQTNRDNMKLLLKIFVQIHALDHARWMSDEYSLRMYK